MNTHKIKTILFLSLSLLFTLSACGGVETPIPDPVVSIGLDYVIAEGHLLPARDSWLNFSAQGRVAEILVSEGEKVTRGQTLMLLADRESAEASLLAAELELTMAQQDYDDFIRTSELVSAKAWQAYLDIQMRRGEAEREWEDLDRDYLEDQIDDALIEVRDRESELEEALEEWEKYEDVDEGNYARQAAADDLEDAQEFFNEAQRNLEEARRKIDVPRADLNATLAAEAEAKREYEMWIEEGVDIDRQTLLESRLTTAEAGVIAARDMLENYTLTAPFAGTVTDIYLEEGQFIGPEARAAQLADLSEFIIETSDLTELEVVKISLDQTVNIVPDSLPDTFLTGKVERIGQSFKTQAGDIIYTVTISLDEIDPNLRWGMTVELTFLPE
ncbi:MAG: efflux RND transporter periplasmic adaptor subunit [Anaerolineales bacterium]|nr:efflux RND transporter periplasmic adaptor subunit [Anaerolineales bacterium]